MKDQFQKEINKIPVPEKQLDLAIESAILKGKKKKWSIGKKIGYLSGAAVLLFGLFIGSAFLSPTMAEVASKILYLNRIFETKPIVEVLSEKLRGEYEIDGIGMQLIPKKTISVAIVGSDEYYESVKDEVEEIIEDTLASKNYDAFKIDVYKQELQMETRDPKQLKYERESKELMDAIRDELEKHDFAILTYGVRNNDIEKVVELDIPNTEKRTDRIKKIVQTIIDKEEMGNFSIKFHKVDMEKREQEQRWYPVIDTIAEGLMGNKKYKVKGIGYSNHPSPMTITIKTKVKSTDPDAKELGAEIEKIVVDFITSKEAKEAVGDDPYKIIVYSKDKKEIN